MATATTATTTASAKVASAPTPAVAASAVFVAAGGERAPFLVVPAYLPGGPEHHR